jgi:hypothetical protein
VSPHFVSRGFVGRRRESVDPSRIPPGQYRTRDFPVLSAGPTPRTPPDRWDLELRGLVARPRRWRWDEFRALPREPVRADVHCVTTWSKLSTEWEGVSLDTLLGEVGPSGAHALAFCDGGYTTNLPLADLRGGKALGGRHLRRRAARARARRAAAPGRRRLGRRAADVDDPPPGRGRRRRGAAPALLRAVSGGALLRVGRVAGAYRLDLRGLRAVRVKTDAE